VYIATKWNEEITPMLALSTNATLFWFIQKYSVLWFGIVSLYVQANTATLEQIGLNIRVFRTLQCPNCTSYK